MKNLNTLKKAELIEMVKELQAKVEELTRVPEPEAKPEEKTLSKKHEDIMTNHKVVGKPMSESQLRAILKTVAYYEVSLTDSFPSFDVQQASELIQVLSDKIKGGAIAKRIGHYNVDELYDKFIHKYPEAYANIMNRNL
jgi:hypothetical protein